MRKKRWAVSTTLPNKPNNRSHAAAALEAAKSSQANRIKDMQKIQHLTADASAECINATLERDGCVVIENLLPASVVDTIARELGNSFDAAKSGSGRFVGYNTRRLGSILRKSGSACQMLAEPKVVAAMENMLLPWCNSIQLNLSQGVSIYPGQKAQILHRDDELFPVRSFGGELMANAMWALCDFTAENGATQVVPGSHRWDREREPKPEEVVAAEMPKGSALLYRGSLIHGGGENRTDAPRPGVIFGYNLGWLRQGENQYLAYPPEVARFLPDHVQRLIGYTVHRPNLGLYECVDPQQLLSPRWTNQLASWDFLTPEQQAILSNAAE